MQSLRAHCLFAIVLVAFVALGVTYSVVTPIFEAGDEIWHYPFVQHLATGHGLPIQDPNVKTLWEQEGGQPPLYYALAALATFWIDTRDLPERLWRNPHARIGIPLLYGNKNLIVHTNAENFPWRGTTLAVHLIRFFSILLGACTVALTYFIAKEILLFSPAPLLPRSPALLAAAIVAFNPMFLFISASVNNDTLAALLATLALLLLARLLTRGATMRRFTALGIVLGLGALTKVSNLGLLVIAAVVFFYLLLRETRESRGARQQGSRGEDVRMPLRTFALLPPCPPAFLSPRSSAFIRVLFSGLLCAALVVAIAAWWYARNWLLYGDPLAFNVWVQIAGGRPTPVTLTSLLDEFQGFRISFWGNFGGVNIIAPEWVYSVLDAFTVLALVGWLVGWWRRALPRLLALPALWLALISISLVRWTLLTMASQGRLIFPAISAVGILMAYGLAQLQIADCRLQILNYELRITNYDLVRPLLAVFLFTFAMLAPFTLIAPVYALPARLPGDASVPNPTHITFDHQAELVGYALPQKSVAPGAELPITLYWRTRTRIIEDFSMNISLVDANGKKIGQWDAFPGNGLYPTRLWQPGEVIVDTYRVPVALDARGPSVARVEVGLYRRAPLENLTARDPQGRVVTPTLARFKIAGQARVQVENPVDYNFADQIALVGYAMDHAARAGDALRVRVYWRALAPMTEDYTVFVHLVDASGKLIAQKDDQPQRGAYPTSFWDAGEMIADEYALALPRDAPPGEYRIEIGIYHAADGTRLPLRAGGDSVGLGTVQVAN